MPQRIEMYVNGVGAHPVQQYPRRSRACVANSPGWGRSSKQTVERDDRTSLPVQCMEGTADSARTSEVARSTTSEFSNGLKGVPAIELDFIFVARFRSTRAITKGMSRD